MPAVGPPPAAPEPMIPPAPPVTSPPPPPPPSEPFSPPPAAAAPVAAGGQINLNAVTFEELRAQNLSVTQATRLLAHRERLGGFRSVDDLDQVAGFPQDVLADIKTRSTV
jgi:competence protein ComEA